MLVVTSYGLEIIRTVVLTRATAGLIITTRCEEKITRKYLIPSVAMLSNRSGILIPARFDLITKKSIREIARKSDRVRISAICLHFERFSRTVQEGKGCGRDLDLSMPTDRTDMVRVQRYRREHWHCA